MTAYRVFPYDRAAYAHEPGGALFAPVSSANRIANPSLFCELYLSDSQAGAIAEAFGRFDTWTRERFVHNGKPYALAGYEIADAGAICNLDNAGRLLALHLRPSEVVARNRRVTQAWAARIYEMNQWIGISWWSRYDSRWQSMGIWDRASITVAAPPEELSLTHPALVEAATLLPRRI